MRQLFFLPFLLAANLAYADDFNLASDIVGVEIYPESALITRTLQLDLPAGEHRIEINDLPTGLEPASLRFFGADGLVINATNFRSDRLPPDARTIAVREEIQIQIDAQEDLIRAEQDSIAALEVTADAARAKLGFLRDLANLNADAGLDLEALRALSNLVAEESANALQTIEDIRLQTADVETRIDALEETLADLKQAQEAAALPPPDRIGVTLDVSVADSMSDQMQITYLVDDASWFPVYEFYLDQESGVLDIIQKAGIAQYTGEDWIDVMVRLSTAKPGQNLSFRMPYVYTESVSEIIENEDPYSRDVGSVAYVAPAAPVVVEESTAFGNVNRLRAGMFTTYQLDTGVTLDGDGAEALFTIDAFSTKAEPYARINGESPTSTGSLTIDFTNTTGAIFLSGNAIFYLDGVFVGSTEYFSEIGENETEPLSFGQINGLVSRNDRLLEIAGESGLISSRNAQKTEEEITVENLTDRTWNVQVFYGATLTKQEVLEIITTTSPEPTTRAHDREQGMFRWDFEIAPEGSEVISIETEMEWPLDWRLNRG